MPTFKDEVGDDIPKPSSQWSELEKRKMSLNSTAMNVLFCALDKKEFHRVSSCESAQKIWNKLEVVYEGTNQVKESKISRYTHQYELFQMEQNENVYSMYTRFTDIVNTLGALGKTFSNSEKVKKIIRSLPKEWRPKRTAIEEAKDLNTLPLDNLIGSLISYEEDLAAEKGHKEKKKSIALKASKHESDGESEPEDEELAMLARRSECPLINKLKKKAMVATWDDSEEESSDEEGSQEVSNLALIAIRGDDDLNEGLKKKKNKWYLDSGCSRHMTGNYHGSQASPKLKMVEMYLLETTQKEKFLEWEMLVLFLANKDDALDAFKVLYKKLQNEKGYDIICIRSDHGGEFKNHAFENFCNNLGIGHQFSSPRTPQQNGVVERKNRSIQEMARTMLNENALPKYFWAEAVNTTCYVLNRVLIRSYLNKTPYELWKDRKPNIGYFKVFGCKCFILNTKDNFGKFDPKYDVGIFLGYSNTSKAYRVYNKRTLVVEESMHVTFDESNPSSAEKGVANDDADGDLREESSKET
ncbi:Integrase catalytic domain-containing protein [Citrus sinensis]|nr:Integrase catalytic domain-containing protein [Citrus sinensis]